jgi:ubiquinone/menaquinone biosynthesis C-methylase UbiE
MHSTNKPYLPATGKDWLLPFYDPLTRLFGVEGFHKELIRQAGITPVHRFLEIGCGTVSLAILVKRQNPDVDVIGIDPDPGALARARQKAQRKRLSLQFDSGFAEKLPYPDASFDRVLSAFMFHHVSLEGKPQMLNEAYRLLKPGGSMHLLDFEEAQQHGSGLHGRLAGIAHSGHGSSPEPIVLRLMQEADFKDCQVVAHKSTIVDELLYYKAVRPPFSNPEPGWQEK